MAIKDKRQAQAIMKEFTRLLRRLYRMEHDTQIRQELERSYLNGFVHAAFFLKLATKEDLAEVIDREKTQSKPLNSTNPNQGNLTLTEPERDFSEYDKPAWERKGD